MVKIVKSLEHIGENVINEFMAMFTFQENNSSQNTYYDSIKKQKVVSFVTTSNEKMPTVAEDENKSFGEIFACFDDQTLNLRQIMNWPVTNKPYSICSEDGNVKANAKSLFGNKLQSLCPVAPTNFARVSASVSDAMRVVRIIPRKGTNPPLYLTWAKKLFAYIENLPGNNRRIAFDNYNCEGDKFTSLSIERLKSSTERNISSLNQVLLNANEWSEFLSNRKNKLQLCNLLADYFTSIEIATGKVLFVTKEKICYIKRPDQIRQVCPLLYSEHVKCTSMQVMLSMQVIVSMQVIMIIMKIVQ